MGLVFLLSQLYRYLGRLVERVLDLHDRRHVAAAIAVVGRREDGDAEVLVRPHEPLHHQLSPRASQRRRHAQRVSRAPPHAQINIYIYTKPCSW